MGTSHQSMTEAQIAATRKDVLRTVRQTRLGRGLLSALGKAQVKIVFSDNISVDADTGEGGKLHGLYDSRVNTLYVDAAAPIHAQLHFFAHEARHALQMHTEKKINNAAQETSIYLISPVTQLYLTRLREVDADVFAVCFVAQHDLHTGSRHFAEMQKRGGFFSQTDTYSRAGLYDAFLDKWSADDNPHDMAASARAVVDAFMRNTPLLNTYNNFALAAWDKVVWAAVLDHAQKPQSDYHKDFRAAALQKNAAQKPRDIFNTRAAAYSKILQKSGAPDYLHGIPADRISTYICESNPQADPWHTTNYKYERAIEKFEDAIRHYTRPAAPANVNTAPRGGKTAKAGPAK